MAPTSTLQSHSAQTYSIENLPEPRLHEWSALGDQIAAYVRKLLEEQDNPVEWIEIPSVMMLTDFFGCSETDVFDALFLLRCHGYEYQLLGLDGALKLSDPLGRKPTNLVRRSKHHYTSQHATQNSSFLPPRPTQSFNEAWQVFYNKAWCGGGV